MLADAISLGVIFLYLPLPPSWLFHRKELTLSIANTIPFRQ